MEYAQPIPYASVAGPALEKNRRGALMAFGVINIVLGAIMALFGMLGVVGMTFVAITPQAFSTRELLNVVISFIFLIALVAVFIWSGIASIRCRRWVRPVIVALAWAVILPSALMMVGALILLRDGGNVLGMPRGDAVVVVMFFAAFMGVFGVAIPALYAWFYASKPVRETLEAYDPASSWTQRCPLPVFTACTWLVLGGLQTLSLAQNAAAPFFGQYIEGAGAVLLVFAAAAVMLIAAVLMYRMNPLGWWMALAVIVIGFASAVITFARTGMIEFYGRGQLGSHELNILRSSKVLSGVTPIVFVVITMAFCVGYMIWIYPHHRPPRGR